MQSGIDCLVLRSLGAVNVTCVLLGKHRPVHHPVKDGEPVFLLRFGLAGKQELPVGGYYGDSKPPVKTLAGRGETGKNEVIVLLAADEHFSSCVGVLGGRRKINALRCCCQSVKNMCMIMMNSDKKQLYSKYG